MAKDFQYQHLNQEQQNIAKAIIGYADHIFGKASGGGCKAFYTPEEWKERGEDYVTDAVLIVCHDGGDLAPLFNWDYCAYELREKMDEVLKKLGFFPEQCTSWYSAIYKKDN